MRLSGLLLLLPPRRYRQPVSTALSWFIPPSRGATVCDRGTLITGLGNKARRDGHVGPGGQVSGGRKGCLGKSHHALRHTLIHKRAFALAALGATPFTHGAERSHLEV